MRQNRLLRLGAAAAALLALAGCSGDPFHMMPEAASDVARRVDELTYLIFWITTVTFVGVQAALLLFLVQYRKKAGAKAKHTHGNHTVEMIWTVAPAAILVFLAVYQMGLWSEVKASSSPKDEPGRRVQVQILARQFEWHFRYPGADGKFGTDDDRRTQNDLVVPLNAVVEAEQRSMDVIHSFYLPNLRLKQDVVPGLHTKLWFKSDKLSAARQPIQVEEGKPPVAMDYWDIVCAELCGANHTNMAGRLYVVSDAEYDQFINGGKLTKLLAVRGMAEVPKTLELLPWDRSSTSGPDYLWVRWSAQDDQTVRQAPAKPKRPFAKPEDEDEGEDE